MAKHKELDDVLLHFGVKGMKWGVIRNLKNKFGGKRGGGKGKSKSKSSKDKEPSFEDDLKELIKLEIEQAKLDGHPRSVIRSLEGELRALEMPKKTSAPAKAKSPSKQKASKPSEHKSSSKEPSFKSDLKDLIKLEIEDLKAAGGNAKEIKKLQEELKRMR